VQAATGFMLDQPAAMAVTSAPTPEQMALIQHLDPQRLRDAVFKDNPPGDRRS